MNYLQTIHEELYVFVIKHSIQSSDARQGRDTAQIDVNIRSKYYITLSPPIPLGLYTLLV